MLRKFIAFIAAFAVCIASVQSPANFASFQASSGSSSFPDATSAADLNFQTGAAFGCASIAACITASNNGGYVQNADGSWTLIASNTLRMGTNGLLAEHATTSFITSTRDLTNAAWTKTNVTAANNAVGICPTCGSNLATTLTASAANGTVCQGSTSTGITTFTSFIKRVTGSGEIDMSIDNGVTWQKVDTINYALMNVQRTLDSVYQPMQLTNYLSTANATICFRIVTNGDAIAVDFSDLQSQNPQAQSYASFWTSPVQTGGTTRNQDVYTAASTLLSTLRGSAFTVKIYYSGMTDAWSPNAWNGPSNVAPSQTATFVDMIDDQTNNNYIFQAGGPYAAGVTVNNSNVLGANSFPPSYPGQDFNDASFPNQANAGVGGWPASGIMCMSSDGTSSFFTMSGGTVATGASVSFSTTLRLFQNTNAYITRMTVYATKHSSATLQSECFVQPTRPTLVDQAVAGTQVYTDFSVGREQALTAFDGAQYGAETGGIGAPGGCSSCGTWNYLRAYTAGNAMQRFGIIPGTPGDPGIVSFTSTERVEANGSFLPPTNIPSGEDYTVGQTVWNSWSMLLAPGNQVLSHDFFTLTQMHNSSVPGTAFIMQSALGTPDTGRWDSSASLAGSKFGAAYTIRRGCWVNVVQMTNLQSTATGEWKVWMNGTLWFDATSIKTIGRATGGDPYAAHFKYGIYRQVTSEMQSAFYANVRTCSQGTECTSREGASDLSGKVASPDAIPAGYTYSSAPMCP